MTELTHQWDTDVMGVSTTVDIYCSRTVEGLEVDYVVIWGERMEGQKVIELAQQYVDDDQMCDRIDALADSWKELRGMI